MENCVVGIDIGGTNTVFGLVTESGEVIHREQIPTGHYPQFESYVNACGDIIDGMRERFPSCKIVTIGVGAPDANFYAGTIEYAANLAWEGVVPLRRFFQERMAVPVVITNDANAAAVGEKLFGAARGVDHFVVITLGTGVGSGFIVNGSVLYGRGSFAGEVGHMQLIPEGRVCGCGRRGCVETYVSATGLVRTTLELQSELMIPSVVRAIPPELLRSKTVYDAASEGDALSQEAFRRTAEYLGQALVDTVLFSNPEKIILFGGLANAGEMLLAPLRLYFEERCLEMFRGSATIECSQLPEADAAVLGAAALGWDEFHK